LSVHTTHSINPLFPSQPCLRARKYLTWGGHPKNCEKIRETRLIMPKFNNNYCEGIDHHNFKKENGKSIDNICNHFVKWDNVHVILKK
jgi:hypothetical protein